MPSMSPRSGGGRRPRRMVNEINVVPYIDVMLVLLVIFMVTAPMLPPGQIDLPTVGKSNALLEGYVEVEIDRDQQMKIRLRNTDNPYERVVSRSELIGVVANLRLDKPLPVAINADKSVPYEAVMYVLDQLKRANVERVGLLGKPEGR